MAELENQEIDNIAALTGSEGVTVEETDAALALLRTKSGTPIIPYVNTATENEVGVVKPDGVTVTVDARGTLTAIGGGGSGNSSTGGLPPSICKNMTIKIEGTQVSLKWEDSGNTILDKQYLCTWGGTKIVKKLGSYPVDENDGELVIDNKIHNQYFKTPFVDTIGSGEDWHYTAFPYSTNNVYCYNSRNNFTEAIIYEYTINPNDSNPMTRVAYPVGSFNEHYSRAFMDFGNGFNYGDWEHAFFHPTPVMLRSNGQVAYNLDKNNYGYKEGGVERSDVANTNFDGNAMLEWGQVWLKYQMDGTLMHVYIANKQVDDSYHCYTHYNKNGVLLDYIYTMIYQPGNINNKLRSMSNITMMTNANGVTMRSYAQVNGDGWDLMDYGEWQMIQALVTLITKSTNTEATLGCGRYSGANNKTGECDADGQFFGTNTNGRIKIFGAENLIANYWKPVLGCVYTAAGIKYKMCDYTADGSTVIGYNKSGDGYLTHQTLTGSSGGYIGQQALTPHGIMPTVVSGGSATTYWCDGCWWANGGFARVGGGYGDGSLDGVFALLLNYSLSVSGAYSGASLSFKPLS